MTEERCAVPIWAPRGCTLELSVTQEKSPETQSPKQEETGGKEVSRAPQNPQDLGRVTQHERALEGHPMR